MSKDHFNTYRFKHEPKSEDWGDSLEQVTTNINNLVSGTYQLDTLIHSFRRLSKSHITTEELGRIRYNHLQEIPVGIWGQIVDKFTNPDQIGTEDTNTFTGWDLLNAGTDLLWHKENPTVTTYGQNAAIVDGLCRAVA